MPRPLGSAVASASASLAEDPTKPSKSSARALEGEAVTVPTAVGAEDLEVRGSEEASVAAPSECRASAEAVKRAALSAVRRSVCASLPSTASGPRADRAVSSCVSWESSTPKRLRATPGEAEAPSASTPTHHLAASAFATAAQREASSSPLNLVPPHVRRTPGVRAAPGSDADACTPTAPSKRTQRNFAPQSATCEASAESREEAVPLPFRKAFSRVAAAVGSVRQPQLQLLLSLLGDLRAPLPLVQVVGGAGAGKSLLVRLLLEESGVAHGFALADAAGALGGNAGRTLLYVQLLGSLGLTLRLEAEACAAPLLKIAERLPPLEGVEEDAEKTRLRESLASLRKAQAALGEESRRAHRARLTTPDAFIEALQTLLEASAAALEAAAAAGEAAARSMREFAEEGLEAARVAEERTQRSVLVVVDGLECVRRFFPEFLQVLLRIHELLFGRSAAAWACASEGHSGSRAVSVLLLGREALPPAALEGLPSPPAVLFPPYSRDEAAFVLQKNFAHLALPLLEVAFLDQTPADFPFRLQVREKAQQREAAAGSGEDRAERLVVRPLGVWLEPTAAADGAEKHEAIDVLATWRRFCGDCCRLLHAQCASDFAQLQFVCRELWGQALQLFLRLRRPSALSLQNEQLRSSAAAASREAFSRLAPDLVECRVSHGEALSFWGQPLAAADSAVRMLQLPRLSQTLLLAAFLAAYTPKKADKQLLRDTCAELLMRGGRPQRKRKAADDALQVLHEGAVLPKAMPRTFRLVRWLALAEMVARRPLVLEEASLLPHVCRLLRLRLVAFHSSSLAQQSAVAGGGAALSTAMEESTGWAHSVGWLPQRTLEAMRIPNADRAAATAASVGFAQLLHPSAAFVFLAETQLVLQAARTLKVPLEQLM